MAVPSVAEVLLNVLGDSTDGRRALASIQRDLAAFDRTDAEAEIRLGGVREASAAVARMKAELESLGRDQLDYEVQIDVDRAVANLNMLDRQLASVWGKEMNRRRRQEPLLGEDAAQQRDVVNQFAQMGASIEAILSRIRARQAANERATMQELAAQAREQARVAAEADRAAADEQKKVRIDVDTSGIASAEAQLAVLERQLRDISNLSADPEIRLRAQSFLSQIAVVRRQIDDVRRDTRDGMVDARGSRAATAAVVGLGRGVASLATDFGRVTAAVAQHSTVLGRASAAWQGFLRGAGEWATRTRDIQEVVMVLAGGIVAALIPAIVGLVGAMAGAAAGAAALGAALAGIGGPVLGLVIGLATRFKAVLDAKKAVEQQNANATNLSAAAERKAAQAEEARLASLRAIRDAHQGVVTAERALTTARENARRAIADSARAEADAARGVTEAQREVGNAQRAITDARRAAHQEVMRAAQTEADAERRLADARRNAAQQVADASQRVADAQARVRSAATEAYDAMAASIRKARDAQLDLRDAQLGIEESLLRVEEAQLAVQEASSGTAQGLADVRREFEQFDRLSVDLGPVFTGGVQSEVTRAAGGGGANDPAARAIALKRALLELKRAKLGVEQASARQSDAEDTVAKSNAEAARFAREGINAYQPYTDAVKALGQAQRDQVRTQGEASRSVAEAVRVESRAHREAQKLRNQDVNDFPAVRAANEGLREANLRLADAQRNLAKATADHQRLQRQGVAGNPAVITAVEGLRDANEQLAEAQRRAKTAGDNQFDSIPAQTNTAQQALKKLTDAERGFLDELTQIGPKLRASLTAGTDQIFLALTDVLASIPQSVFDLLGDVFTQLGTAWGQSIRRVGAELLQPAWLDALKVFGDAGARVTSPVTEAFIAFFGMIRDLGLAFLPDLLDLVQSISGGLQDMATSAGGVRGMRTTFAPMVGLFRSVLRVVVQVARVIVNFVEAGAPGFQVLADMIGAAAKGIADFLGSASGIQIVQGFLRDMAEPSRQLVAFLGQLVIVILQLMRFGAQFGGIIMPIFTDLLRVLNLVLAVLLPLTSMFFGLIHVVSDLVALTIGTAINGWAMILVALAGVLERVAGWFLRLIDQGAFFARGLDALRGTLANVVPILRAVGTTLLAAVAAAFRNFAPTLVNAGLSVMRRVVGAIRGLFGTFTGLGLAITHAVGNGLLSAVGWLVAQGGRLIGFLLAPFRAFVGLVRGLVAPVVGVMRAILNGVIGVVNAVIGGINALIGAINAIPDFDTPLGHVGIPDIAPIGTVPFLAAGGVATMDTLARIGDAGREAVLPLTDRVFAQLGASIARAMVVTPGGGVAGGGAVATAVAPGGPGGVVEQHFHIPPSPAAHGQPDARDTAAKLALAMRKTGARRG